MMLLQEYGMATSEQVAQAKEAALNDPDEKDAVDFLIEMQIPFIVATTKTDKLSKSALKLALEELENTYFKDTGIDIIPFSSVTRDGKDELWKRIYDAVSK